jgi:hypothetical protein
VLAATLGLGACSLTTVRPSAEPAPTAAPSAGEPAAELPDGSLALDALGVSFALPSG